MGGMSSRAPKKEEIMDRNAIEELRETLEKLKSFLRWYNIRVDYVISDQKDSSSHIQEVVGKEDKGKGGEK